MDNVGVDPSLIQDRTQLDLEKAVEEHNDFEKKFENAYAEVAHKNSVSASADFV